MRSTIVPDPYDVIKTVLLGGKSLGSARPVLRMYITPLITSRIDAPFAAAGLARRAAG